MEYLVSVTTDIGTRKSSNQDSISIKVIQTSQGRMVLAVLCDGMGGLEKGEVASAAVIRAFDRWAKESLPALAVNPILDSDIRHQWEQLIVEQSNEIKMYGARQGVRLGTTVVAVLITPTRYYAVNVGDSRLYEFTNVFKQITADQTFVAREVALGNMTPEQAEVDPRRSVLLQCVGASDEVYPDMFFGETQKDAVYMLCSDGFRHVITPQEIYDYLNPGILTDEATMNTHCEHLIEVNKQRGENDNISVAVIRTY